MSLSPHKFREIVFQFLFSRDAHPSEEETMVNLIMTELAVSKKNVKLAQERVNQIFSHLAEIDALITSVSISYDFDRIQSVTKNILRLGVFELYFDPSIPPKVVIAEAVRLSRKFCTPESASFANALLDHLYHKKMGTPKAAANEIEKEAESLLKSEEVIQNLPKELKQLEDTEE